MRTLAALGTLLPVPAASNNLSTSIPFHTGRASFGLDAIASTLVLVPSVTDLVENALCTSATPFDLPYRGHRRQPGDRLPYYGELHSPQLSGYVQYLLLL